jgi:hypothetical protein
MLFNEKVLCGLGKGLGSSGRMDAEAVERALIALKRFRALSLQARATDIYVLATAAARRSSSCPVRKRRGIPHWVLSAAFTTPTALLVILAAGRWSSSISGAAISGGE